MRLRKFFFWSFLALFTAIVLALTWLWTADLGVFKPQIERLVTEKTGREFAIDGDLLIDHPDDPECHEPGWNSEAVAVPVTSLLSSTALAVTLGGTGLCLGLRGRRGSQSSRRTL